MTEPTESPSGKPWLLALGVGLLAGAVGWLWWSRRDCGCEHEEGTQEPSGPATPSSFYRHSFDALARIRKVPGGEVELHPDAKVAPLDWDSHAENAWGVAFGGERKLDDFRAPVDELAEFEAELGGEG